MVSRGVRGTCSSMRARFLWTLLTSLALAWVIQACNLEKNTDHPPAVEIALPEFEPNLPADDTTATPIPDLNTPVPGPSPTLEPSLPTPSPPWLSPTPPPFQDTPWPSPTPGTQEPTSAPDLPTPTPSPPPDTDGDGFSELEGDCDDADPVVYPGAAEICDGKDNDCDGLVDDRDPDAQGVPEWYLDADGDGYGDRSGDVIQHRCERPDGYADNQLDCDDSQPDVHPNAPELCDGKDNDCDIQVDEGPDEDGDGFSACQDCDDTDATVYPGAPEACDGQDNDCDGTTDEGVKAPTLYADDDGDGFGDSSVSVQTCPPPAGFVSSSDDCDDDDPTVYPGAEEVCDERDNDCDGTVDEDVVPTWYLDYDADGYGGDRWSVTACEPPTAQYVALDGDCDDTREDFFPGATPGCDGLDHDCDGLIDHDDDLDGYSDAACGGDDCNDLNPAMYPDSNGLCALGSSCRDILENDFGDGDGVYVVDPDGLGVGNQPFEVYCDMTSDGGGWTVVADWDRERRGDDLEAFEQVWEQLFNDMGEFTDGLGPFLQWSDYDNTADVMAYQVRVPVPNGGEARVEIHYDGQSMEKSGTFLFLEVQAAQWNVLCWDDTRSGDYSAEEWAFHPTYPCPMTSSMSWTWEDTFLTDTGIEISAIHLRSFHLDNNHGDLSRLYRLWIGVR